VYCIGNSLIFHIRKGSQYITEFEKASSNICFKIRQLYVTQAGNGILLATR